MSKKNVNSNSSLNSPSHLLQLFKEFKKKTLSKDKESSKKNQMSTSVFYVVDSECDPDPATCPLIPVGISMPTETIGPGQHSEKQQSSRPGLNNMNNSYCCESSASDLKNVKLNDSYPSSPNKNSNNSTRVITREKNGVVEQLDASNTLSSSHIVFDNDKDAFDITTSPTPKSLTSGKTVSFHEEILTELEQFGLRAIITNSLNKSNPNFKHLTNLTSSTEMGNFHSSTGSLGQTCCSNRSFTFNNSRESFMSTNSSGFHSDIDTPMSQAEDLFSSITLSDTPGPASFSVTMKSEPQPITVPRKHLEESGSRFSLSSTASTSSTSTPSPFKSMLTKFTMRKKDRNNSSSVENIQIEETMLKPNNPTFSSSEDLAKNYSNPSIGTSSLTEQSSTEHICQFIGRAEALVDSTASPYDTTALRFKKGDIIDIISKRPTGSWTGKVHGKVGDFKFIWVRLLPDKPSCSLDTQNGGLKLTKRLSPSLLTPKELEQRRKVAVAINEIRKERRISETQRPRRSSEQGSCSLEPIQCEFEFPVHRRASSVSQEVTRSPTKIHKKRKGRPKSVAELLKRIQLDHLIAILTLHGFDTVKYFKQIEDSDLDRLNIICTSDRRILLTAVELLREYDTEIPQNEFMVDVEQDQEQSLDIPESLEPEEIEYKQNLQLPKDDLSKNPLDNNTTVVRDSGVFLKEEQDEILTQNTSLESKDKDGEDLRQKFLKAKSVFENTVGKT